MRLESVELALREFLTADDPRVIALSGLWGRGNSYFWRRFLEALSSEEANRRSYSYVSLFGLENLTALRDALFENSLSLSSLRLTNIGLRTSDT